MEHKTQSNELLRIFLCHSSGDKPAVRNLYHRLSTDGFNPWLDEEDLLPGQDWQQEIPRAVRNSDIVIVCLSCSSIGKSGYVQKEIKYALDVADEQPEGTIFLIPLKLEECEIPERLRRWQWVNYFEEKGYDRLKRALISRASTLVRSLIEKPLESSPVVFSDNFNVQKQEVHNVHYNELAIQENDKVDSKDSVPPQIMLIEEAPIEISPQNTATEEKTHVDQTESSNDYLTTILLIIAAMLLIGGGGAFAYYSGHLISTGFLGMVIISPIIGAFARLILPGHDPMGCLMTCLLSITGSFLSGLIVYLFSPQRGFHPGGVLPSLIGAVVLIVTWRMLARRN